MLAASKKLITSYTSVSPWIHHDTSGVPCRDSILRVARSGDDSPYWALLTAPSDHFPGHTVAEAFTRVSCGSLDPAVNWTALFIAGLRWADWQRCT